MQKCAKVSDDFQLQSLDLQSQKTFDRIFLDEIGHFIN